MDTVVDGLYLDKPKTRNSSMTGFVVPTAAAILVAPASAKRKRITFTSNGAAVINLFQQPTLDLNRFLPFATALGPLTFDFNDVGTMIQAAWFAQASVSSANLGVVDTVEE